MSVRDLEPVATTEWSPEIQAKLRAYYTRYYRDALGLPNWDKNVEGRVREETLEQIRFRHAMEGRRLPAGGRFLNIGCGTGGVNIVAHQMGLDTYGIEPAEDALEICRLKAEVLGIPVDHFQKAYAERMPFPDDHFDIVYCYTVLEHVQDVEASLRELVRVLKPGGYAFIDIPNYLSFYEGHYKVFWLPFFPKPLARRYLRWRRRPTDFLSTINYVTPGRLLRTLRTMPVQIDQTPVDLRWKRSVKDWGIRAAYRSLGIGTGEIRVTKRKI